MLFDVTTLYFESADEGELCKRGYSKDNRAKKNARGRQKLLYRLLRKLGKSADDHVSADSIIGNRGMKKYLKLLDGESPNNDVLDEEKISAEARWDGLRAIVTDLPLFTVEEIREVLRHFHSLWRITDDSLS